MKTLYITDLDGTLLNSQVKVSEFSLNTINGLIEKGINFTYATARSFTSAAQVTEGLKLVCPVIVYNGAFTIDPTTKEIIAGNFFSEAEKNYIIKLINENGLNPLVYAFVDGIEKVSWFNGLENEGMKRYIATRRGDPRLNPLSNLNDLYKGDIFYFTCIGDRDELLPLFKGLQDNPSYISYLQRDLYLGDYWCEVMPGIASKGHAALKLKKIMNCHKIVSFGDARNDIPLFKASDECYAVENASAELKDEATAIILSNDEDGVAKFLAGELKLEG